MDSCCQTEEKAQIDWERERKGVKDRGRDSRRSVRLMADGAREMESPASPSLLGGEN